VTHLLHLVAKVSPGAKLGSTAPYDWASLVLVEAGEEHRARSPTRSSHR
jgi:CRISPR system Cascade subunit CasC